MNGWSTKQFRTPEMAERYLGHSTEPHAVDWTPLPEQKAPARPLRLPKRRKPPVGHAIRKLLAAR